MNRYSWTELIGYPVLGVVDQLEEHCFGNRLQRRFTIAFGKEAALMSSVPMHS